IDRVDRKRLGEVDVQVKAVLGSTALNAAPLFALDATAAAHPGTTALRHHLHQMAAHTGARPDQGLFRLAVDRVFTLAGRGTVVTGTVFSGQVRTGDSVAVMPAGQSVRVRSIHAQNRVAEAGRAGERCALNLAGIEKSAISRGDWLADPRALAPSTRIDVRIDLLADSGAHLESWSPLHVHFGTTHRVAHVVLLESAGPSAGESARRTAVVHTPGCRP